MTMEQWTRRIGEVIKVEAKDTGYADFLATHKEFANILVAGTRETKDQAKSMKEDELFRLFMDQREQHQFYLVKGDNGTGKSHLIRWLKEKYMQSISSDKESVLFISRAQSTLRGALEQIIQANLLQDETLTDNLKKLVNANEHLSSEGLKQRILHHFAIAVQQDDDNHILKMDPRLRKQLYAFLVEQATQDLLLRPGGPIERIQKKLASEAKHEAMTEVTPYFQSSDFNLTYEQASFLKKSDISRLAERFVESIAETTSASDIIAVRAYRESCANYLNQFLEVVVQECTQLRGTDLRNVFMTLRQELKKQGKNLTLFVEDITSFTGIDKELVNVLAFTNEGTDFDESLCRLISVVGVTNEYYRNHFPDNYIDRVTGEWYTDGAALVSKDDVVELTALYLNAIYSERKVLEEWAREGADPDTLPISNLYDEHQWAKVSYRGRLLTVYPFTPNALKLFYDNLGQKTPRRLLTSVIRKYVHDLLVSGPREMLPDFSDLHHTLSVRPFWSDSDEASLHRQASGSDFNRYLTLLRVWGDSTMKEDKDSEGHTTIGGLPEAAFQTFGLRFLTGQRSSVEGINPKPAIGATTRPGDSLRPVKPVEPIPEPSPVTVSVPSPPVTDIKQERFANSQKEIEGWMYGESLSSYGQYLRLIIDFLKSTIRWEDFDVLPSYVTDFLSPRRLEIEGQTGKVHAKEVNKIVFTRSQLFRGALLAFAAWRDLGKESWEFNDAPMYLQRLMSWFESIMPSIVQFVRKPSSEEKWHDREWTVLAQYYIAGFSGKLQDTSSAESIYLALNHSFSRIVSKRDPEWNNLAELINHDYAEFTSDNYVKYFNCAQGDPTKSSSVVFLDAASILRIIQSFKDAKWDIDLYPTAKKENLSWYKASNFLYSFKGKFSVALKYEKENLYRLISRIRELCGKELLQEQIENTFDGIQVMITWMKDNRIPFSHEDYAIMNTSEWKVEKFIQSVQSMREFDSITDVHYLFALLSQDPRLLVHSYLEVLQKFEKLMDEQYERYSGIYNSLDLSDDGFKELGIARSHLTQLSETFSQLR
ncbi:hypothetical protein [Paenibacillus lautus]|uniref:ATP-binding protein n=1 Tax=Paenibacillus lautus TaxID=1401 RepID=A0A385TUU9_PAELA|nr:hypothetical protein [Paenibacillus lautus]AYB46272.1 hypothetical protein D5F53_24555 [Paenibacillus lautus]